MRSSRLRNSDAVGSFEGLLISYVVNVRILASLVRITVRTPYPFNALALPAPWVRREPG